MHKTDPPATSIGIFQIKSKSYNLIWPDYHGSFCTNVSQIKQRKCKLFSKQILKHFQSRLQQIHPIPNLCRGCLGKLPERKILRCIFCEWGKRSHSSLISWPFGKRKKTRCFLPKSNCLSSSSDLHYLFTGHGTPRPSHQIHKSLSHLISSSTFNSSQGGNTNWPTTRKWEKQDL